jgi:hypothetical protein
MAIWAEMNEDFKTLLRLRTEPVAFRRLEKAEGVLGDYFGEMA